MVNVGHRLHVPLILWSLQTHPEIPQIKVQMRLSDYNQLYCIHEIPWQHTSSSLSSSPSLKNQSYCWSDETQYHYIVFSIAKVHWSTLKSPCQNSSHSLQNRSLCGPNSESFVITFTQNALNDHFPKSMNSFLIHTPPPGKHYLQHIFQMLSVFKTVKNTFKMIERGQFKGATKSIVQVLQW